VWVVGCTTRPAEAPRPTAEVTPTLSPKRTSTPAPEPSPTRAIATARPSAMPTATSTLLPTAIRIGQYPYTMTVEGQASDGTTQAIEVGYLLYLPEGYGRDPQQKWPLVLFLHGQLEWGDDPMILVRQGVPKLLDEGVDLPAIIASPQTPQGKRWWTRTAILGSFLDRIEATYAVDLQRVYLTGISMGGYGAWALAMRYPQRFAALVPIAGGADYNSDDVPPEICGLKDVPTWAFHGQMDVNVPYTESVDAVDALRACGGNVRLTLYADAVHVESWERAYADDELWAWLFEQKRK
jgi:predicted peptidase